MKFKEIFEGNNSAYGVMRLTGETTEKGKAVAKAIIKREPVVDSLDQNLVVHICSYLQKNLYLHH